LGRGRISNRRRMLRQPRNLRAPPPSAKQGRSSDRLSSSRSREAEKARTHRKARGPRDGEPLSTFQEGRRPGAPVFLASQGAGDRFFSGCSKKTTSRPPGQRRGPGPMSRGSKLAAKLGGIFLRSGVPRPGPHMAEPLPRGNMFLVDARPGRRGRDEAAIFRGSKGPMENCPGGPTSQDFFKETGA